MTNKYLVIVSLLSLGPALGLRVVQHSPPVVVHQGEGASLFCKSDLEYERCSWILPNNRTCGPLSSSQRMCRRLEVIFIYLLYWNYDTLERLG